jgi:hypothetical protein
MASADSRSGVTLTLSKQCGVQRDRFGPESRAFINRMPFARDHRFNVEVASDSDSDSEDEEVCVPGFGTITEHEAKILDAPPSPDLESPGIGPPSHETSDASAINAVPQVARTRLNLTALSQHYNVSGVYPWRA